MEDSDNEVPTTSHHGNTAYQGDHAGVSFLENLEPNEDHDISVDVGALDYQDDDEVWEDLEDLDEDYLEDENEDDLNAANYEDYDDEFEAEDSEISDEEDKEQVNVNFKELVLDDVAQKVVKAKKFKRNLAKIPYSNRLTDEFKLLMGEANLALAKGDRSAATNICLEIIRNIPDSPAPYETLSIISEEENDLYKSLQYGLISAHLWPSDPMKWYGLAQKCIDLNDTDNHKICMAKALRYSHLTKDKSFVEELISYFVGADSDDKLKEDTAKMLVIGYKKLIKVSWENDRAELKILVDNFEMKCDEIMKKDFWAQVYISFCTAFPDEWDVEKLEKICGVYLEMKCYKRIIDLLVASSTAFAEKSQVKTSGDVHADVQDRLEAIIRTPMSAASNTLCPVYTLPHENTSTYLRAALLVSLIHTDHSQENIDHISHPLLTLYDPSEVRKELNIVADAFYDTHNYEAAFPIYEMLTSSSNNEHAHSWIRLGDCFQFKDDWPEAVKAYERVLMFDKSNEKAKLKLFSLQKEHLAENEDQFSVNLHDDYTNITDLSERPDIVKLSYHRTLQLVKEKQFQAAMDEGYSVYKTVLIDSMEKNQSYKAGKDDVKGQFTSVHAFNYVLHILKIRKNFANLNRYDKYKEMLSRDKWYEWYIAIMACCMATNQLHKGFVVALGGLASRLVDVQKYMKNIQVHSLYLAGVLNYPDYLSEAIGFLMFNNPDTNGIWNLFYSVRHRLPHYRLVRLGLRWLIRNKGNVNGLFVNAQNTYHSKHYRACVAFFRQILGQRPNDGNIYFYLSQLYLHFACNKSVEFSQRRHEMVVQAVACIFMYHRLSGPCQESFYNIGRCYHYLGLFHLSLEYYKKALNTPPALSPTVQAQQRDINNDITARDQEPVGEIDLTQEIVYNMSLIYRQYGSSHLARQIMYMHSVV